MEVVNGGSGFATAPTITVVSQDGGSGVVIVPTMRRRTLDLQDTVTLKNKPAGAKFIQMQNPHD